MDKIISWALTIATAYLAIYGVMSMARGNRVARCELTIETINSYNPIRMTADGKFEVYEGSAPLPEDEWVNVYSCDCGSSGGGIPVCVVGEL